MGRIEKDRVIGAKSRTLKLEQFSGVSAMSQVRELPLGKKGVACLRLHPESVAEMGFKAKFLDSQPSALSSTDLGFPAYEEEGSQLGVSKMLLLGTENGRGYF